MRYVRWALLSIFCGSLVGCGEALSETKKTDTECNPKSSCGFFSPCADGYECVEVSSFCEGKTRKICKPEKGGWSVSGGEVEVGPVKIQGKKEQGNEVRQEEKPRPSYKMCRSKSGWEYVCLEQ